MVDSGVSFFVPHDLDPSRFEDLDPDADWEPFRTAWAQAIPHTYLKLRAAGLPVTLSGVPPRSGIAVVFAGDMREFMARTGPNPPFTVVCVQADRLVADVSLADVIVQHNGLRADAQRRFFIANWPQAGLKPRDPQRGPTLTTVAYKGNPENLRAEFLSREWEQALDRLGMDFVIDSDLDQADLANLGLGPRIRAGSTHRWHDYSDVDAILAVRPARRDLYRHKPAVKLVNAWRAGVPALLGPEAAYRELRRSQFDYREVSSVKDAERELQRLRDETSLFTNIVENGTERGVEFSVAAITQAWEDLLFTKVPSLRVKTARRMFQGASLPARRVAMSLHKRISARL